jgi:hypothetical protein
VDKRVAHYCIARSKIKFMPDSKWFLEHGQYPRRVQQLHLREKKRYRSSRTARENGKLVEGWRNNSSEDVPPTSWLRIL